MKPEPRKLVDLERARRLRAIDAKADKLLRGRPEIQASLKRWLITLAAASPLR